jgi:hypothetical protein
MKRFLLLLLSLPLLSYSQVAFNGSELGVELYAGASTLGGSVGGDLKYAAI